jgi:ribosomal protein S18 acetylase RimI-like enzyme
MIATIRPATTDDIPAIKRIADADKDALGFTKTGALGAAIARQFVYVADQRGEVVGYCEFWRYKDGTQVTIYSVAVAAEYRRQGIGKMLVGAVAALAPLCQLKCTTDNEANYFYARLGFQLARVEEPSGKRALNVFQRRG